MYRVQFIGSMASEKTMKVISTKCSKEQQERDMPEILSLNEEAKKTEMLWEFSGGTITLPNGNKYQAEK